MTRYRDIAKNFTLSDDFIGLLSNQGVLTIPHLIDSDIAEGVRFYCGEHVNGTLEWHIYKVTYIRSGVVFYKRDFSQKEDFFVLGSVSMMWMYPIEVRLHHFPDNSPIHTVCPYTKITHIR